ncbi:NAD-dependent epimerase/dehydratase family protein [Pseudoalteromonas piscicida]|uniref:NAD(P)-dependent oxidoreductase n=1 Tax=Pseudoalteromonas piscicida TaxID=43662 RepID=A0AAD0W379_PSEO7|nr:NAD(P)-dependent oxidoreductase [Pseudoalteromonas piscicida]ASD67494.1 hypothetical protein B1L02_11015 [Pseudoalteromonas piscicida]AXR01804.1 NAD(P)-dependent oxidoreductase [Pseudoalteromonas piscicida]
MDRTLILGGSGYIGRNIAATLAEQGMAVTALSRKDVDLENQHQGVADLVEHLRDCDNLIICSAITRTVANDTDSCQQNIIQLQTILKALQNTTPKRVVYLSAADVYGHYGSQAQEIAPLEPKNEYGAFKVFAEHMLRINLAHQCRLSIMRFSGVFGGVGDTSSLIYRLFHSVKSGAEITLTNNGQSKRDFVPVTLIASAAYSLLTNNKSGTYNVSTGQEMNIADVIKLIESVSSTQARLRLFQQKSDRDFDLSLDNSRLELSLPYLVVPNMLTSLTHFVSELNDE